MNSRVVLFVLLGLLGLPVLLVLGQWSATDPVFAGAAALAVVGIIILTQLGQKVWLLIPFFSSFTGAMVILPGNFAPRDLAVGVVVAQLALIWVVRRFPLRFRFGPVEATLLFVLLFLAQAFLRNPAGLSVLGGDSVGARPYFELGVSVCAFLVLSTQVVDLRGVKLLIMALFIGSVCNAMYETLAGMIPAIGYHSARIYRGSMAGSSAALHLGIRDQAGGSAGRLMYLRFFPTPLMRMVFAYHAPLNAINPFRIGVFLVVLFCAACVLLSGFRSLVAAMGLFAIAAAIIHRKTVQVFIMGMIGVPLLALLLMLQGSVIELPLPAQRALSFLPADWSAAATVDSEGSTDWRVEMWKLALTSDRYIRNKWLGDGYGFTADELAYQQDLEMQGVGSRFRQDYYLITGTYHSGPVETIKRVGYIGLAGLMLGMILMARQAMKLVNRSRGTPYYHYAVFLALPLLVMPVMFVFVFGTFQGALSSMLAVGGMMRMLESSLDQWVPEPKAGRTSVERAIPISPRGMRRA